MLQWQHGQAKATMATPMMNSPAQAQPIEPGKSPLMTRLSSLTRNATAVHGRVTNRDREIIKAVYEYRCLTTEQIERLFFPVDPNNPRKNKSDQCTLRLRFLFHHGYLARDEQLQKLSEGKKDFIYLLDQKGADLLTQAGIDVSWNKAYNRVNPFFLNHRLKLNDVRIAITLAAKTKGLTIEKWLDDDKLKSDEMKDYVKIKEGSKEKKTPVIPDAYFLLSDREWEYHNCLEVDLRTEPGGDFARKVKTYKAYFDSGAYKKRYGTESLIVLTVTTGEKRLANLKKITEDEKNTNWFWFTTFAHVTPEKILTAPIWHVAGDNTLRSLIE